MPKYFKTIITNLQHFFQNDVCIISSLIGVAFIYFLSHIQYYHVPDPDVFQYIHEGEMYIRHPFTWMATPPVYSIWLFLLDYLIPITNSGVLVGTFFNILFVCATSFLVWKLSKPWMGKFAIIAAACFIVNPITAHSALQPINATAAVFFSFLYIYIRNTHPSLGYLFIALAYFCRLEAIILLPIAIIGELIEYKTIRKPFVFLIVGLMTLYWTIYGYQSDPQYLQEVNARIDEIPNYKFLILTFVSAIFNSSSTSLFFAYIMMSWLLLGVIVISQKKRSVTPVIFGLYILGYCYIHWRFPVAVPRYSYPALPFIFGILFWPVIYLKQLTPKFRYMLLLIICFISIIVLYRSVMFRDFQSHLQWSRADKRLAGEWLRINVKNPTIIYGFMSDIIQYYSHDPRIVYPNFFDKNQMINIMCAGTHDIVVFVDNDPKRRQYYYSYGKGEVFVDTFMESPAFVFYRKIETLRIQEMKLDIYKYTKDQKSDTELQKICD